MFCYLLTFLNGHKTVVVCKKEIFSVDFSQFKFESQIFSVQMLNTDDIIVVE